MKQDEGNRKKGRKKEEKYAMHWTKIRRMKSCDIRKLLGSWGVER
jgi:hypothetical protein